MRQVVLDTETTGLSVKDGHRIIEIGCLEMINRRLTDNNLHIYINPERELDQGAINVHGLTAEFLSDKPIFATVIEEILEYLKGAELIIHNAPFDVSFLNYELQLAGRKYGNIYDYCTVIDTLPMARRKHPGQHNSLDALCKRYSVDNSNRDLHGALLDSELLAQVYLLMTGGQTQLFEAEKNSARHKKTTTQENIKIERTDPLLIVEPDSEELAAHEKFLQEMKNKDGCLWLEQE